MAKSPSGRSSGQRAGGAASGRSEWKIGEDARPFVGKATALNAFLSATEALTLEQRATLVDQAIVLIEGFYAHLPLKRAMHAADPLQRLRLLRHRLEQFDNESSFHAEMTQIFTSLRDRHTKYQLPPPFSDAVAALPFRVEACWEGGGRKYIVADVADGFSHPTFGAGVEVRYWNGVPIARAVERAAERDAGSNPDAAVSRGLAALTARPLVTALPPDEEWVVVGYRTADGKDYELRVDWVVTGLPGEQAVDPNSRAAVAGALGIDLETDIVRQLNKLLFAPQVVAASVRLAAAMGDTRSLIQGTESVMPSIFKASVASTSHGQFGYVRIWTFNVDDADAFVAEFVRLAALLPQNGLIIDVRDNGGGLIYAGEQLLQVLTPRTIEPERLQFINSPLTLLLCKGATQDFALSRWAMSIERSLETGATFSAGFPLSSPDECNAIGQQYHGPVVLVTSARSYSTTDFFAAGFQDHAIGPILGIDNNTGAGGANVWTHDLLHKVFDGMTGGDRKPTESPLRPLPNKAGMRIAIRRSLRVGPQSGTEVEDLGVKPDYLHRMTRNDVLKGNIDLIEHAAELLAAMPVYALAVRATRGPGEAVCLEVTTKNVGRVDVYMDQRPRGSWEIKGDAAMIDLGAPVDKDAVVIVQGYSANGQLVAARRMKPARSGSAA